MKIYGIKSIGLILALMLVLSTVQAVIPQSVNYQAYLKDGADQPVNAVESMTFRIYDANVAGTVLWSETQSVSIVDGLLSVALGSAANPLPQNALSRPLWLSIEVGSGGESNPRIAFNSVNNAFRAQDAATLGGVDVSELQARVTGTCPAGSAIRAVDVNGGVSCETDTDTTYDGNDFALSNQTCASEQVAMGIDSSGSLICSNDVADNSADIAANSAAITSHAASTVNPHSVSSLQIDAPVSVDLSTHQASSSAHHIPYTDSQAVNAVMAADGSGSGLDADLLDGLSFSSLLRSNASDAYTSGTLTMNSETALQLDGITKVGSSSSTNDDSLYFDDGINQYLRWADLPNRFELSDDLLVSFALSVGVTDGSTYTYNLMRNNTSVPESGDMSSRGDVFIGYDLEVGGELYADHILYMYRNPGADHDEDQNIYFYNAGNRAAENIGWNDFEGRFDSSTHLKTGSNFVVTGNLYAETDLHVSGSADIGYHTILLAPNQLTNTVTCLLDTSDEQCYHDSIYFSCGAGERIISGGCSCTNFESQGRECYIVRNIASGVNQWNCAAIAPNAGVYVEGRIICAKVGYGD